MRVALVHDYLNQEGGAERVAEVLCSTFPGAPMYTSPSSGVGSSGVSISTVPTTVAPGLVGGATT